MIVYIDMDDVLCEYSKEIESKLKQFPEISFPQSQLGFFANLTPIADAIESVKHLIESNKFTPYILTAPSILNPHCYTEKRIWIEKHFGLDFVDRLIISSNKALLKGDVLIDDYTEGRGQENFDGQLIHFGSDKFPDWKAVVEYLNSTYGN
jgi:5'(3')-deoxyribonucleotidase